MYQHWAAALLNPPPCWTIAVASFCTKALWRNASETCGCAKGATAGGAEGQYRPTGLIPVPDQIIGESLRSQGALGAFL